MKIPRKTQICFIWPARDLSSLLGSSVVVYNTDEWQQERPADELQGHIPHLSMTEGISLNIPLDLPLTNQTGWKALDLFKSVQASRARLSMEI